MAEINYHTVAAVSGMLIGFAVSWGMMRATVKSIATEILRLTQIIDKLQSDVRQLTIDVAVLHDRQREERKLNAL